LESEDMAVAYSLDFHPNPDYRMLAAAGKGGYACLFSVPQREETKTSSPKLLYSFRAHERWVGCIRFLTHFTANSCSKLLPIVTCADDCKLKLWDLSKTGKKTPQPLFVRSDVHDRGIFALDVCGGDILTGSKDHTVCHSAISLEDGSWRGILQRYELHSGVVKSVQWQPNADESSNLIQHTNIFASGGQDRSVCIKDVRNSASTPEFKILNAHDGGVHSVSWAPSFKTNSHLLASAAMDDVLKVWDIRYLNLRESNKAPMYEFKGHHQAKRIKSILPPKWLSSSKLVIPGEGSQSLSVYCAVSGKTISRGALPTIPVGTCMSPSGDVAAATRNGIYLLKPIY